MGMSERIKEFYWTWLDLGHKAEWATAGAILVLAAVLWWKL